MTDHTTSNSGVEQDELGGLLHYISNDPSLRSQRDAKAFVTYSRMIRLVSQLRRGQVELSASHGMHVGDFDILFLLQRAGDRLLRVTDIAVTLHVTPGGISKRVDRLAAGGMVQREAAQDDRRASVVRLTQKGRDLANSARSLSTRPKSLDVLNEAEWQQLDDLLKRVADAHTRNDPKGLPIGST